MDKQRTSWTTHTTDDAQPKSAAGKPQETPAPTGWMYNRTLAAVVLAVTVVCSVAFGVNKGVRTAYRDVTEAYAMGLDGSGYGVAYYANGMQEHAVNLCKIAEKTGMKAYWIRTMSVRQLQQPGMLKQQGRPSMR